MGRGKILIPFAYALIVSIIGSNAFSPVPLFPSRHHHQRCAPAQVHDPFNELQSNARSLIQKIRKKLCKEEDSVDDKEPEEKPLPPPTIEDLKKFHRDMAQYLFEVQLGGRRVDDLKSIAGDLEHQFNYQEFAQVFNRRFKPKPYFVVYCESTKDVQVTFLLARQNNIPIRIRAGAHDHEAESSGDNLVVIDVSKMKKIDFTNVTETGIVGIGPGNIFQRLTSCLAEHDVMIPHGTCGTVGIAGFTMGGGWGPYTRRDGMCCEHLMGVTLILGDGTKVDIDDRTEEGERLPDLLWALRGGGGFSYGLVTELRIKTFSLARELIRFNITWNPYPDAEDKNGHIVYRVDDPVEEVPTLDVLQMWEKSIKSTTTSQLTGTNLQVDARRCEDVMDVNYRTAYNSCIMYGYWEGDEAELRHFVFESFGQEGFPYHLHINPDRGGIDFKDTDYGTKLMSDWARVNNAGVLRAAALREPDFMLGSSVNKQLLDEGKPFPPDVDDAEPHKLTSRLVDSVGLGERGYEAYIKSMLSPKVLPGNRNLGINQYATLGAIVGDYYRKNTDGTASSFPYNEKLYTIQYQTWWNLEIAEQVCGVYERTNRALDWIQEAREYEIPNTSGSFISFKDSSIPTKTYFDKSYERLVQVKKDFSRDPDNYFRSRKTII